ncbi:hypothetical protein E4U39_002444, partial [Claviceps sp. Clav50 group G5]
SALLKIPGSCRTTSKIELQNTSDSDATATNSVELEEDVFPGTFLGDEHNVALSSTEPEDDFPI